MSAADDPRTYHRRIAEPFEGMNKDTVPTLCGRVVNYQQSMKSIDDVDCPACCSAADVLVNAFVRDMKGLIAPALAAFRRQ